LTPLLVTAVPLTSSAVASWPAAPLVPTLTPILGACGRVPENLAAMSPIDGKRRGGRTPQPPLPARNLRLFSPARALTRGLHEQLVLTTVTAIRGLLVCLHETRGSRSRTGYVQGTGRADGRRADTNVGLMHRPESIYNAGAIGCPCLSSGDRPGVTRPRRPGSTGSPPPADQVALDQGHTPSGLPPASGPRRAWTRSPRAYSMHRGRRVPRRFTSASP